MKILFTSDANGHEYHNPYATLVELSEFVNKDELAKLELRQLGVGRRGVGRRGGDWKELVEELQKERGITYTVLLQKRMRDIDHWYEYWRYELISGNY